MTDTIGSSCIKKECEDTDYVCACKTCEEKK